jgi:hypothetical protein
VFRGSKGQDSAIAGNNTICVVGTEGQVPRPYETRKMGPVPKSPYLNLSFELWLNRLIICLGLNF